MSELPNTVVQVSLDDLQKLLDDTVDRKLQMKKHDSTGTNRTSRSISSDGDDPRSPPFSGGSRPKSLNLSSPAFVSEMEEPISPRGTNDEDIETFDCDPRQWILAAGRLEKKRDGNVSIVSCFFVFTMILK